MVEVLAKSQALTAWVLTGTIWVIQLLHYPAFRYVSAERFREFHQFHTSRITFWVAPWMSLELFGALAWWWVEWERFGDTFFRFSFWNLVVVVGIWASTFFLSVPLHEKLSRGYHSKLVDRLVSTNWLRTVLWSLRAVGLTGTFFY
jgi:hypothetical protein